MTLLLCTSFCMDSDPQGSAVTGSNGGCKMPSLPVAACLKGMPSKSLAKARALSGDIGVCVCMHMLQSNRQQHSSRSTHSSAGAEHQMSLLPPEAGVSHSCLQCDQRHGQNSSRNTLACLGPCKHTHTHTMQLVCESMTHCLLLEAV